MPQTITYKDNALIEKDAELCSHHENLHICARDMNSYHLLERYFSRNNIYLVPDTAWGLYDVLKKHSVDDNVGKSMLMKRKDFEIGKEWNICADDVKDWDDILHEINIDCKFLMYRVLNKLGRMFNGHVFFKLSDLFLMNVLYPSILKKVNEYFLKYKMIYSTRLHGFIFSVMLHLPVEWQDTKYGKLSGYYETWFGEK